MRNANAQDIVAVCAFVSQIALCDTKTCHPCHCLPMLEPLYFLGLWEDGKVIWSLSDAKKEGSRCAKGQSRGRRHRLCLPIFPPFEEIQGRQRGPSCHPNAIVCPPIRNLERLASLATRATIYCMGRIALVAAILVCPPAKTGLAPFTRATTRAINRTFSLIFLHLGAFHAFGIRAQKSPVNR